MTPVRTADLVLRYSGTLALVLGLAFWAGYLTGLVPLHMVLGLAVAVSLWVLAALALRRPALRGLGIAAAIWGVIVIALGVGQTNLLVGTSHWIVQLLHLLVGLGALGLGAVLAKRIRVG